MSQRPRRLLARAITTPKFDVLAAQLACWIVSVLVFLLGMLKLSQLPFSEGELFLGILLVVNLSMTGVLIGLVLPLAVRMGQESSE